MILALKRTRQQDRPALAMAREEQLPAEISRLPDTNSDWSLSLHDKYPELTWETRSTPEDSYI